MRTVDPAKYRAKRRQIVRAAAALFATHGFDGTTTAAICKAAGTSAGNLFHYFSSKREIFRAVFEDEEHEKAERLATARVSEDALAALLEVVDLLAAPAAEPLAPPLVMEAIVQAHRDTELAEQLARVDEAEQAAVESLVARAAAAGQIAPGIEARDAASWIMASIGSLYVRAAVDPQFKPAEQISTLHLLVQRFLRAGN